MAMDAARKLLVILGPTCSGKSSLALNVARRTGAQMLSVDAMQVYQDMNIGTAKPSAAEQNEIRHHLINCVPPDESFSVARFVELAEGVISHAAQKDETPILGDFPSSPCTQGEGWGGGSLFEPPRKCVKPAQTGSPLIACGGTPLYYKSLFYGLFEGPGADSAVRERLNALSGEELHERLKTADPAAAARIHPGDQKRLIRALEVFELTGRPISSFQTDWDSPAGARFPAVWIGLRWETAELNRRLNARTKEMIAAGWIDEVRDLIKRYPNWSQTASGAMGYQFLRQHLEGRMTLDDAFEQIKISTRQLARRQMKWFKRFPGVHWLEGNRPMEQNVEEVLQLWRARV